MRCSTSRFAIANRWCGIFDEEAKIRSRLTVATTLNSCGTSGIGLATAKRFAAEGAHAIVTRRRKSELDAAVAAIGADAVGHQVDSSQLADLDRLFAAVGAAEGRIDVLFVNAGGGSTLPLDEITEEQYDDTFGRNVKGVLFTVQGALPFLGRGASVILTGSTTSIMGTPAFSVYAASKAAVRAFARNWILDVKERGIRINMLSPGPTRTPGFVDLAGPEAAQQQALVDQLAAQVPLGRVAEADEIAAAAVFLASDDASYVTGVELFVDGGMAQV